MPQITTLDLFPEFGKFVLEPLERGYGQTIGNTLRRVLLGSIQGLAISAVRIDKVFHEFAPIPGVKEDTTELLLNLKDVAIRYTGTAQFTEATLTISVKGPGRVTGADINCPEDISIVNPEVYIATISDARVTFGVELKVTSGTGYILPEKQEQHKNVIGLIPMGSHYTPVRKVNYSVEQTRVGNRTDYERLVLDVWTNGAIRPNDAVAQAAHILDRYFRLFFDLGNADFIDDEIPDSVQVEEFLDLPDKKIEELEFSQRTLNSLRRAGMNSLRLLAGTSEGDFAAIRGFGKKSLLEVRDKLLEYGITLAPSKSGRYVEVMDDGEEDEAEYL